MDIGREKLIELYRKSNKNKTILQPLFNPNHGCFGCMIIAEMTLEQACKNFNIDINTLIQKLS